MILSSLAKIGYYFEKSVSNTDMYCAHFYKTATSIYVNWWWVVLVNYLEAVDVAVRADLCWVAAEAVLDCPYVS